MNDFFNIIICWITLIKQIPAITREVRTYHLGLLREKRKNLKSWYCHMFHDNGTSLFINYTIQLESYAMNKVTFLNIKRHDMQNLSEYHC